MSCIKREISDLYVEGRKGVDGLVIIVTHLESRLSVVHVVVALIYESDGENRVRALVILIKSKAINLYKALLFQVLRVRF